MTIESSEQERPSVLHGDSGRGVKSSHVEAFSKAS